MPTQYELDRLENMKRNKRLLEEFGIKHASVNVLGVQPKPPKTARKRKIPPPSDSEQSDEGRALPSPSKVARVADGTPNVRRSLRNAGKTVDYNAEQMDSPVKTVVKKAGKTSDREPGYLSKRVYDPCAF
jgi:hypothetical protein